MSIMINPLNARLGVSRFWVTNFLPIVHSNYPLATKRNYEDFVGTLEKFLVCFFNGSFRNLFFKFDIVYSSFHFNCFKFPKKNNDNSHYLKQYHDLELIFHDFRSDYHSILSLVGRQSTIVFKSVLKKQYHFINHLTRKFTTQGVKYARLLRTQKHISIIFDILNIYRNLRIDLKQIMKRNMVRFQLLLERFFFYYRINRLYNFFFNYNRLHLKIRFIPFSYRFSADLLSHFIIKKVKLGTPVVIVLSMIYRFAQKNKSICGLRIVCSGRFNRGQKAGFLIRSLGRFNFGFFESTKNGYILDYSETTLHLRKGLVGIRIWLSQKMAITNHIYPLKKTAKSSKDSRLSKFKYKHANVL